MSRRAERTKFCVHAWWPPGHVDSRRLLQLLQAWRRLTLRIVECIERSKVPGLRRRIARRMPAGGEIKVIEGIRGGDARLRVVLQHPVQKIECWRCEMSVVSYGLASRQPEWYGVRTVWWKLAQVRVIRAEEGLDSVRRNEPDILQQSLFVLGPAEELTAHYHLGEDAPARPHVDLRAV